MRLQLEPRPKLSDRIRIATTTDKFVGPGRGETEFVVSCRPRVDRSSRHAVSDWPWPRCGGANEQALTPRHGGGSIRSPQAMGVLLARAATHNRPGRPS